MARRFPHWLFVAVIMMGALALSLSCKSAPKAEAPVTTPPAFETKPQPAEKVDETAGFKEAQPVVEPVQESASSLAEKLNTQGLLKKIYFDFDRADLKADAMSALQANAAALKQYPQFKLRVEGHCDERGTVEYNLALGERRARAARDYLASLGVAGDRISIVSFGKERPADPGHSEEAWSRNRRDEFLFVAE